MNNPGGRIEFANSLRGLAAFAVLISHYFGVFWYARDTAGQMANTIVPSVDQVPVPFYAEWVVTFPVAMAPFGVALFFLISGFVIPFSIIKSSTMAFLVGRFFRIYPLYIAGFSITLLSIIISGKVSGFAFPYNIDSVLYHYLPGVHLMAGTPGIDGIIWTLEIEIAFYILCAITAPLIRSGSLFFFFIPLLLILFVYFFHDYPWTSNLKILAHVSEYIIFMIIGVAFNYVFRGLLSLKKVIIIVIIIACLFFCGMLINNDPNSVAISYAAALIIFTLSAVTSKYWKSSAILGFLADISYPLYVVHGVMGYAILAHLTSAGVSPFASIMAATITSVTVAWILHVTIETPSHNVGKKLMKLISVKKTYAV
ncbi:acyltransferase family protein [Atlantibacter hermannii]|uniref:acyltransferase family protein n=1 Tax=Atlantibacter hermannii TaxID=565 RepID=UPI0028A5AD0A|nr:acyltransferase [Atlantibacter hermannii]